MRKKKPKSDLVLLTIGIRVTLDEYNLIKQAAEFQHRSMSNYARLILLDTANNEIKNQPVK